MKTTIWNKKCVSRVQSWLSTRFPHRLPMVALDPVGVGCFHVVRAQAEQWRADHGGHPTPALIARHWDQSVGCRFDKVHEGTHWAPIPRTVLTYLRVFKRSLNLDFWSLMLPRDSLLSTIFASNWQETTNHQQLIGHSPSQIIGSLSRNMKASCTAV